MTNPLFALFPLLDDPASVGGKRVGLSADILIPLLAQHDPWEYSTALEAAPVDYLVGLGARNGLTPNQIQHGWRTLEACLRHPNAPDPTTWSHRLSCLTDRASAYSAGAVPNQWNRRVPWLHALALSPLNGHIETYCALGGTMEVEHEGLSALQFLFNSPVLEKWMAAAHQQGVDLTQGNLSAHMNFWIKEHNHTLTQSGAFAERVRAARAQHIPLDPAERSWEEFLETAQLLSGYKNTMQKIKHPDVLAALQRNERKQQQLADALVAKIPAVVDERYLRFDSNQSGALKALASVWNKAVPATSPAQDAWRQASVVYSLSDAPGWSRPQGKHLFESFVGLRQTLGDKISDAQVEVLLRAHARQFTFADARPYLHDLPITLYGSELQNKLRTATSTTAAAEALAVVGNRALAAGVPLHYSFVREFSDNDFVAPLEKAIALVDPSSLPGRWCQRVQEVLVNADDPRASKSVEMLRALVSKALLSQALGPQEEELPTPTASPRRRM